MKRKFLVGTIVGGAVGSVVGLLLAPKSGKETRAEIARRGTAVKKEVLSAKTPEKRKALAKGILRAFLGTPAKRPLPPKK